ncbi:hypothetical protein [Cohnella faecalis]|uniref:Uncharacterized protein n=1 Tax=Cohnella faecalis TaxID=2315694 RepID=A0A398CD10_9BACL|nr:hypothetical protein [Cohnella faecalis]RIE00600.1 hypothetical protein D3H35_27460 [Cohnella faecalis]
MHSAHLSLDYGNPADPATLKHADFVFDKDRAEARRFEVFMNERLDTDTSIPSNTILILYRGGRKQDKLRAAAPAKGRSDAAAQSFRGHRFLELQVKASNVDWGVVDSIEVRLEYRQPGGELLSKYLF